MRKKVRILKRQQNSLWGRGSGSKLVRLRYEQEGLQRGWFINQPKSILKKEKIKKLQLSQKDIERISKENDLSKDLKNMIYG